MAAADIVIRGAREHNLRNLDLTLPRNKLIVMTGVSGSGKSSLAFDTLFAEGQRRYVESLSTYARQFLGQMPKPDVDSITGLAPSISIQQKVTSRNPRSTVGTITEIYDYLRVLYARVGQGHCAQCGKPITAQSTDQILDGICTLPEGVKFLVLAPIVQQQKGEFRDLFTDLLKQGFLRARVDGEVVSLSDDLQLKKHFKHTIEVVVDRLVMGTGIRSRLAEAVESAIRLSGGGLLISVPGGADDADDERLYSANYACSNCSISYEPPSPQLFSFNSPLGMCLDCNGLGMRHEFLLERLIADERKSISRGCLELLGSLRKVGRWRRHLYLGVARAIEQDCGLIEDSFLKTTWMDIPSEARRLFLDGMGDRNITFTWRHSGGAWKHGGKWEGYLNKLLDDYLKARNPMRRRQLEKYMETVTCTSCDGARLNPQARNVRLTSKSLPHATRGRQSESKSKTKKKRTRAACGTESLALPQLCALPIADAVRFFENLELDETQQFIAGEAIKEVRGRLGFLLRCGLDYLSLERKAPTLSGGESQRIRLAGQIGCGLVGVVYILDEPSIGLHPRDNAMLLESLCDLRDQGNTVIVVEHDEETMRAADHIVDFGPGPGVRGGEIVAQGNYAGILAKSKSLTGAYLSGKKEIPIPDSRRNADAGKLKVVGAKHNNLREIDVEFPVGTFICVTGVSGSGKSSLVNDILWQVLKKDVNGGHGNPGRHTRVNGLKQIDKAIDIDQSPIGRTPRSNPATYVKVFDEIRALFAKLPPSKVRGYKPGRFSFNIAGGRCEACEGHGATKLEMDFLADIWVPCPVCEGRRFSHETLEVRYKEKSIADVLEMDVQEALEHFQNHPKVNKLLQTLHDVGLDYLKLGQPSPTLSGGEAQRIKLARELGKRSTGSTVYLLDEPTTGLHFADVEKLLEVLQGFVNAGNTVIVVEHNLDVIKTADWIIDLGPEGGAGGGQVVVAGTPEDVAACKESYTGRALQDTLQDGARRSRKRGKARNKTNGAKRTTSSSATNDRDSSDAITVRGAAQHNLQNLDVTIPRDRMSVFCGPSGSGKTSLAMDTLYAEGQRRYVESLSAYARQFLGQMPKPKLEHIHGLSPSIAIEQKTVGSTPRSTVGTVTEVYDYLRVIFARLGQPHCPDCDSAVTRQTTDEIVDRVMSHTAGTRLIVAAPAQISPGQKYDQLWQRISTQGFLRVRVDGTTHLIDDVPDIDQRREHDVEIVVDRIKVEAKSRGRIADSIEAALDLGKGVVHLLHSDPDVAEEKWRVDRLSLHYSCPSCPADSQRVFEELTPQHFSFNSPLGWCPACEGLGAERGTNLSALIPNPNLSLNEGAVAAWPSAQDNELFQAILSSLNTECGIPLDVPYYQLDSRHQRTILYGTGDRWLAVNLMSHDGNGSTSRTGLYVQYKGLYPAIDEASRVSYESRKRLQDLMGETACSICHGDRVRDDAAAVRFKSMTLPQLCRRPLGEVLEFLQSLKCSRRERQIAGDLLHEATHRLTFLVDVGLQYLTLDRSMPTLSGGESQRIRLAGQIGRALTGVLYVLDEPTIGLHPRDNGRLIQALHKLRDLGNTLILVEHDREVIESADRLYDFGPGRPVRRDRCCRWDAEADCTTRQVVVDRRYLSGQRGIPVPIQRRVTRVNGEKKANGSPASRNAEYQTPTDVWLEITGCRHHNLRDVSARIPLGALTCVTGVSGSGKSSLVEDTLARAVARRLNRSGEAPGPHETLSGVEQLNKLIDVNQQPLGATPVSNPATYTGVFELIRELFSRMPESRVRGYRPGRFSFNRAGGRCEECEGMGQKKIEMHFLPDVWVECDTCRGKRFNQETLGVKYRGHSVADVLEMSIGRALELFENIPKIRAHLATLSAIGLDYLTLGQSAPTLSGGEAQRVKLAAELAHPHGGRTLYLLDEPTTGLHFDDIAKLLSVLNSLVEEGNTVVIVEHNLDIIKTADWMIDLGPEAGGDGGRIVVEGTPEEVAAYSVSKEVSRGAAARSYTGELLEPILASETRGEIETFSAKQAAKKRQGDLDMRQVGRDSELPWKVDGRKWHTQERPARNGKPTRWEGAALECVVDILAENEGFKPTNWNDQSTVEVTARKKVGSGWFFHALTGDEWLLRLYFRVPKKTFDLDSLRRQIALPSVDDLDELQVYGRGERIRVKNAKGPFQEISFDVHWKEEIDTPEFRDFLDRAVGAYLGQVGAAGAKIEDLTPWKVLGQKWHLSRKGFPSRKRISWPPAVLEELVGLIEDVCPNVDFDWSNKQVVHVRHNGSEQPWAQIHTKRRGGVDLTLLTESGQIALGRIATFGAEREIAAHRDGRDAVKLRFDAPDQVRSAEMRQLLAEQTQG